MESPPEHSRSGGLFMDGQACSIPCTVGPYIPGDQGVGFWAKVGAL